MMAMGDLVEQLRKSSLVASETARWLAEAKSLRQEENPEGRKDLYSWPSPGQTIEGRAADEITTLRAQLAASEAARGELVGALEWIDNRTKWHSSTAALEVCTIARKAIAQHKGADHGGE